MSAWAPLSASSYFSYSLPPKLLMSPLSPAGLAERVKVCGYQSAALTDAGGLAGVVKFHREMKARGLKPILGQKFFLNETPEEKGGNKTFGRVVVLAKNAAGWKGLLRASAFSHSPERFHGVPRLSLLQLAQFAEGNWVVLAGRPGSALADGIFNNPKLAYLAQTKEGASAHLLPQEKLLEQVGHYQELFGRGNVFLEIQLVDLENTPAVGLIASALRWVSSKTGIPCVAAADPHYARSEDAEDQRVLLCCAYQTTLKEAHKKFPLCDDPLLSCFLRSSRFHLPTVDELSILHPPEELTNSLRAAELCEEYEIARKPALPKFDCPGNQTSSDYLRALCREGWKSRIVGRVPKHKHPEYVERVNHELGVIGSVGLDPYFLIVQDYVNWARSQGWMAQARGSGAGSLVTYLLGISDSWVDPLEFGLLFERFYNPGRAGSLPDLDVDFPRNKRDQLIAHLRQKYGNDKVCHMATYGRLQGRNAVTDVLRVHGKGTFEEWKKITKPIPDESKISDDLQDMKEEEGEASIIKWALENRAEQLNDWCVLKDGNLEGPYWREFAQAIRLEGVKRGQSKHASGVIIAPEPLSDFLPMAFDRADQEMVSATSMEDTEALGGVKFDCLALLGLDRLMSAEEQIRTGVMT